MKVKLLMILGIFSLSLACGNLSNLAKADENSAKTNSSLQNSNAGNNENTSSPAKSDKKSETERNLLSLASGAYLVKEPKSERAFDNSPINIIFDGMTWRSNEGEVTNQVFVIETPGETTLKEVGFNTHHIFYTIEENAKEVLVEASNTNAESGFQKILETSLEKESKISVFPVSAQIPARWFRLTIKNNHGSESAAALKNIIGYGMQITAGVPSNLTGTYREIDQKNDKAKDSDSGDLFIKQDGTSIAGCWRENGSFSGGLEGTVANLDWQQPDLGKNKGLMVFADNKRLVFWRLKGEGFWALEQFERINSEVGVCAEIPNFKTDDVAKSEITKELEKDGRAVIYGINFDFNSDKLRDESKVVLEKIVKILKEKADWKMTIEGHTDNVGGEAFNQTLSEKRAKAVVNYLTNAGVDASRLNASGKGLSSPIASNETDLGRSQNRRVELVKQ